MLINNVGLVLGERRITPDGLEHVFALNHLAPFLLLPKLTASALARVVTVTSDAHSAARLDLSDPNLEHGWDSWRSYANSKLDDGATKHLSGQYERVETGVGRI